MHEVVREDFVEGGAQAGVQVQDFDDEGLGLVRDGYVFREGVGVETDFAVGGFDVVSFKWGFADQHCLDYDTKTPHVDFIRVATFAFQDFRRDVVWSTANCAFLLSVKLEFCRQTKVCQLQLHLVRQKQIA